MSRQVDLELINTKNRNREQLVRDGLFIEQSEQEERTPDSIKNEAKEILGLGQNDLIMLEYEAKLANQNNMTKSFVSLNNFISKAEDLSMLTDSELDSIKGIENRLALIISDLYEIELEDLYTKGGI